jgi:hypothetical protein
MSNQPILLAQSDFKIPKPTTSAQDTQKTQNQKTTIAIEQPSTEGGFGLPNGISSTEMAIGVAIFLVLLIPFFFAKLAVTRGLQSRLAAPSAASGAGWMFFVWLAYTALFLIVATIGKFWSVLFMIGPGGLICLVLLIIFLVMRSQALKTRR